MAARRRQAHSRCTSQAPFLFPSKSRSMGPWRSTPQWLPPACGSTLEAPFHGAMVVDARIWLPPTCGPTLAAASSCPTPTTRALRRAHGDHTHAQGRHGARLNAFQDDANLSALLDEQGSPRCHTSPHLGGG
jgi:hypothetical protein